MGTYLKKYFWFVLVTYPHRQSRKRMMNTLLIISRCMSVGPLLRPMCRICVGYPMSSKFHLSKWKRYSSHFIDRYLKIEEVEDLIHYVKFRMWTALFYVNSLCFPKIFEFWCFCTLFIPIYTEIDNWDFECCSRLDFPIFPMMKEIKKLEFSRLGSAW